MAGVFPSNSANFSSSPNTGVNPIAADGYVGPPNAALGAAPANAAASFPAGMQLGANQLFIESAKGNITANPGGGQTNATQLTNEINVVSTVATAGDSVKLPPSVAGLSVILTNSSSNPMQVFGAGTDTIDAVASATGVSQMPSSQTIYSCAVAGAWTSNGIGTGYSGSYPTVSFTNNITANAGGGQGSAVLLPTVINRVTTVATAGDSVKLPPASGGLQLFVANAAATNSMNVFPNTGDAINGAAVNTAFAVAAGKTATFIAASTGFWHAILSA